MAMNCLQSICGISLRNHVPNVAMLIRCNAFSVDSHLHSKRLRWLGRNFKMPNDIVPKQLLFGVVKGLCPIVSMMWHYVIAKLLHH